MKIIFDFVKDVNVKNLVLIYLFDKNIFIVFVDF